MTGYDRLCLVSSDPADFPIKTRLKTPKTVKKWASYNQYEFLLTLTLTLSPSPSP